MASIILKLYTLFGDISFLLSRGYHLPHRQQLILDYLRLRFKAFLSRWMHWQNERFLSYKVTFATYPLFFEIFRQIFVRQSYYFETDKKVPLILDCGGNMGMSVLYFKYLYPEARITVFEPSTSIGNILESNLKNNELRDVEIVQAAVGKEDGTAILYARGEGSCGDTLSQVISEINDRDEKGEKIRTVKLSSYLRKTVDFLKMDIEGSEGIALHELRVAGVLPNIKEIAFEYHHYPEDAANDLSKMLLTLKEEGFNVQIYLDDLTPAAFHGFSTGGHYYSLIRAMRNTYANTRLGL